MTYYPMTGKTQGIWLSKSWFNEEQIIMLLLGGLYRFNTPLTTAPGGEPLRTRLFCKSHSDIIGMESDWNPGTLDESIEVRIWMKFLDQYYEEKLIKTIMQDPEKWEKDVWDFALDIKEKIHEEF